MKEKSQRSNVLHIVCLKIPINMFKCVCTLCVHSCKCVCMILSYASSHISSKIVNFLLSFSLALWLFVGFYDGCWIYASVVKCHIRVRIQSQEHKNRSHPLICFPSFLSTFWFRWTFRTHMRKTHLPSIKFEKREREQNTFPIMWRGRIPLPLAHRDAFE